MFFLKKKILPAVLAYLAISLGAFLFAEEPPVLKISARDYPEYCRVIVELPFPLSSVVEKSDELLLVRVRAEDSFPIQRTNFKSRFMESLGWSKGSDFYILTVKLSHANFTYDTFRTPNPPQIVIDIFPGNMPRSSSLLKNAQPDISREALPYNERDEGRDFSRSIENSPDSPSLQAVSSRIKTLVIDPGHGGLETGAKGKFGTLEKDVTLEVSQKLKNIIEKKLAFRVVMTRDKDMDISLDSRAAVANNNNAFMFISIHANSSYRKEARGSETFFLSLNATDEEARRLAYLENNSSDLEERIQGDEEDEIKMILWDMAQSANLKQSSQLAENIQKELNVLLKTRNRGIKQAPFKVLTGVACPAVLVEIAFISNPEEERQMLNEEFQTKVAEAIYRGLLDFLKIYSKE